MHGRVWIMHERVWIMHERVFMHGRVFMHERVFMDESCTKGSSWRLFSMKGSSSNQKTICTWSGSFCFILTAKAEACFGHIRPLLISFSVYLTKISLARWHRVFIANARKHCPSASAAQSVAALFIVWLCFYLLRHLRNCMHGYGLVCWPPPLSSSGNVCVWVWMVLW